MWSQLLCTWVGTLQSMSVELLLQGCHFVHQSFLGCIELTATLFHRCKEQLMFPNLVNMRRSLTSARG